MPAGARGPASVATGDGAVVLIAATCRNFAGGFCIAVVG